MSDMIVNKTNFFTSLPPEWPEDLLPSIRTRIKNAGTKIVILDDDPTGTQTVHGLPVLTTWDVNSLKKEFNTDDCAFFILTNSRAMTKPSACRLSRQIGTNLKQASEQTGKKFVIISRSDSTLRGHFPHEVDEMAQATGDTDLPYLICPFFLEGGRYTLNDIHYVAQGEELVPAAQTSYARDAGFGFSHSNLCQWIEEKTKGRIPADTVISISLDDIRNGGPDRVKEILGQVPSKRACIVNAVSYTDIDVLVSGLLDAEADGKRFLLRTAASFVRGRAGIVPRTTYLSEKELVSDDLPTSTASTGGLFIVGSYVPKTTSQVNTLLAKTRIVPVSVTVEKVLGTDSRDTEIGTAVNKVNAALKTGKDCLIYTSRDLVKGDDPDASLGIGQAVSSSLIEIISRIAYQPRYLVAKGGITASDVATKGLNVKRAVVLGQVLPGVPVWKLGKESSRPGMAYIIFPGNVGRDDDLVTLQQKLKLASKG